MNCANSHDRPGNGVRSADRNACQGGAEQGNGSGAFGTESAEGLQLGNFLPHGMNDAPSPEVSTSGNGCVGGQDDGPAKFPPVAQHVSFGHESARVESAGDDAHSFLGVVATMAQAVCGGGEQLQFAEPP